MVQRKEKDVPLGEDKETAQAVLNVADKVDKAKIGDPDDGVEEMMAKAQKAEDDKFMEDYDDVVMDELISMGYVSHTFDIVEGFSFKIRTLKKKEELDIKKRISNYEGAQIYVLDESNTNTIAYCLVEINGSELPDDFEKRREIVEDLSDVVTVAIIDEFRDLNKALVVLIKGSSKNSLARRLLGPELI